MSVYANSPYYFSVTQAHTLIAKFNENARRGPIYAESIGNYVAVGLIESEEGEYGSGWFSLVVFIDPADNLEISIEAADTSAISAPFEYRGYTYTVYYLSGNPSWGDVTGFSSPTLEGAFSAGHVHITNGNLAESLQRFATNWNTLADTIGLRNGSADDIDRVVVTLEYPEPGYALANSLVSLVPNVGVVDYTTISWTEKVSGDPATQAESGLNYVASIPINTSHNMAERVKVVCKSAKENNVTTVLTASCRRGENDYTIGIIRITFGKTGSLDPFVNIDDPSDDNEGGDGIGTAAIIGATIPFTVTLEPSAKATGFVSIYNPSLIEVRDLAYYMWNADPTTHEWWRRIVADPMDLILGLQYVPVPVPSGSPQVIKVGFFETTVSMKPATRQFVEVDCGALTINEFWGAYLDYSPYTKIELYLPYCGMHPINTDDVMGKTVSIKYQVDILSGACVAMVAVNGSVMYTFSGNCAAPVPVTSQQFGDLIQAGVQLAASIGSMVATGGLSAPIAATGKALPMAHQTARMINAGVSTGSSAANTVMSMKPTVERSGAVGSTAGMMAPQKPYFIITRPRQAIPAQQNKYTGYPAFTTHQIGNLQGYTEIEALHLSVPGATDAEYEEIASLLQGGIIL